MEQRSVEPGTLLLIGVELLATCLLVDVTLKSVTVAATFLFDMLIAFLRFALPSAIVAVLFSNMRRLFRYPWLRREWLDFLQQFKMRGIGGYVAGAKVQCPICVDSVPATPWHITVLPCCSKTICWPCVRRYAESVVEDMRPEMLCPFAQCKPLADKLVLSAIRREQWSWSALDITGSRAWSKRRRYDRWVLSCGLAASCAARAEDVVHCSTDDCGHTWVLPNELRRRKSDTEPPEQLGSQVLAGREDFRLVHASHRGWAGSPPCQLPEV
eukprot:CAMPEP_0117486398 /NCGR_PEP_ID=MMETSP0784-20121206/15456_1 /TAXON_ID=39447 /ORGANISM="" /LENGTH=269 /DNA_ID=CAMNT_0005281007 /DNA_START=69 /DNA_END=877 /DNA_ORIENTATION=-